MEILMWSVGGFFLCLTVFILLSQCEKHVKKVCDCCYSTNEDNYVPIGFRVYYILAILVGFIPLLGVIFGFIKWVITLFELLDASWGEPKIRIIEGSFADKIVKIFNYNLKNKIRK